MIFVHHSTIAKPSTRIIHPPSNKAIYFFCLFVLLSLT